MTSRVRSCLPAMVFVAAAAVDAQGAPRLKIAPANLGLGATFGPSICVDRDSMAVGADHQDLGSRDNERGVAYVFELGRR